ncbi:hypothetical protein [Desulfobacter postgatei]|mgnify:CR=1 FL=1|uniref:hypothetical protein n=1 Tax=Desulfobacter postgatei TaxID=2293 RepID=UPI002FDAA983
MFMDFVSGFIICLGLALANLPFVLRKGGSMPNLIAMIFCGSLALYHLLMAVFKR